MNRRASCVGTFEVFEAAHVALRTLLAFSQPVNCIFWPIGMLNWLVAASKLHKHKRETCCTAEWPFYSFLILCLNSCQTSNLPITALLTKLKMLRSRPIKIVFQVIECIASLSTNEVMIVSSCHEGVCWVDPLYSNFECYQCIDKQYDYIVVVGIKHCYK